MQGHSGVRRRTDVLLFCKAFRRFFDRRLRRGMTRAAALLQRFAVLSSSENKVITAACYDHPFDLYNLISTTTTGRLAPRKELP